MRSTYGIPSDFPGKSDQKIGMADRQDAFSKLDDSASRGKPFRELGKAERIERLDRSGTGRKKTFPDEN